MAKVKVLINGNEIDEKKEIEKTIDKLKKKDKERLQGFLQGLAFSVQCRG